MDCQFVCLIWIFDNQNQTTSTRENKGRVLRFGRERKGKNVYLGCQVILRRWWRFSVAWRFMNHREVHGEGRWLSGNMVVGLVRCGSGIGWLWCWCLSAVVVLGGLVQWSWRFGGEATKFAWERKLKREYQKIWKYKYNLLIQK